MTHEYLVFDNNLHIRFGTNEGSFLVLGILDLHHVAKLRTTHLPHLNVSDIGSGMCDRVPVDNNKGTYNTIRIETNRDQDANLQILHLLTHRSMMATNEW